jgi:hypothetical protein
MNMLKVLLLILLTFLSEKVLSQSIEITNNQDIDFGTFSQYDDVGGTVTVSNTGSRSNTGNIIFIGSTFSYASFTITTDSTNLFSLEIDKPTISLLGSNGGSMSLQISTANPEFPSVVSGSPAIVYIGGTLTVGTRSTNPPGAYSKNYILTFNVHYE